MNIIIVSGFFYPEITPRSFRTTELVKELCRRGYSVTLYVPYRKFDYGDFLKLYPVKIVYFTNHEFKVKLPKGQGLIDRGYRFLYYCFCNMTEYPNILYVKGIEKALSCGEQADLLISIAAPHSVHWGVAKAIKHKKISVKKWIADCGDPFMGNQTSKHPFYFSILEKEFCKLADKITIPIEEAKKGYYLEFRKKLIVNPQGFDFSKRYEKTQENGVLTFIYAGILYKGYRDLSQFVKLLKSRYSDVMFRFVLYTPQCSLTEKYQALLGNKIEIRNFIPRDQLLPILANADFLINMQNKGSVQAPSKLIDYALANRPILSVGESIDEKTVDEFMNRKYEKAMLLPDMSRYDIKTVCDLFLNL